jgi:hypothetical protein
MRKCPPNAQNEYTMAALHSTENEVYSGAAESEAATYCDWQWTRGSEVDYIFTLAI